MMRRTTVLIAAGVAIVFHGRIPDGSVSFAAPNAVRGPAAAQEQWPIATLREELRIVSSEASIGTSLTPVSGLFVLRDGRIVTVHRAEAAVRFFDAAGKFITMMGRKGEGPGEFRAPTHGGTIGDTIWIADLSADKYELFTPDLKPLRRISTPRAGGLHYGPITTRSAAKRVGKFDSAMSVITFDASAATQRSFTVPSRRNAHRFDITLREAGRDGGAVTSEKLTVLSPLSTGPQLSRVPKSDELVLIESAELWDGNSGQLRIQRLSLSTGARLSTVTLSLPATRIPASKRDSLREAPRVFAGAAAEYRQKVQLPEYFPALSGFDADDAGRVWLYEYAHPNQPLVVDRSGKVLMRVQLPANLTVLARTATHVYGTLTDANDLPIIMRYRIAVN